jgi:enoyl-CoA hydratase
MSAFETVLVEKRGSVAFVTLNRPKALNVHNVQMRDDLWEVLGAVKADEEVRAVVFQGAGDRAFCAGADLSEFLSAPPPTEARQVRFDRDLWGLFLSVPQPIVAALHGYVLGSGIEIALCCDLRLATENAVFGLPEVGLGIIPAAGGTQTVPRNLSRGLAFEMLLANRWLTAQEALAAGWISRLVKSREELDAAAEETARGLAGRNPGLMRAAKQAVHRGLDLPLPQALEMERRLAAHVAGAR